MNLVVDTSVWSLVLRRPRVDENNSYVQAFRHHVEHENALFLIGNILQELLDGVKTQQAFTTLNKLLTPFPLLDLTRDTYVYAAQLRNACRAKGIQAGPIDFLISAVCIEYGFPILTADHDFSNIAKHSELVVLEPS